MALRPTVPASKPPSRPKWVRPRGKIYPDLRELRARTIAGHADDPLADTDWWAVIERNVDRRNKVLYRRITRIKTGLRLPTGIWTIRSHWDPVSGKNGRGHVIARFEGYRPWWKNASEASRESDYEACVLVTMRGEPDVPAIGDEEYDEGPPVRIRERTT